MVYALRNRSIAQPISCPVKLSLVAQTVAQAEGPEYLDGSDAPPVNSSGGTTLLDKRLASLKESYTVLPGKRNRNHARRKRKRDEQILKEGHSATPVALKKLSSISKPVYTKLASDRLPTAAGGYTALPLNLKAKDNMDESLAALLKEGFEYIKWDGRTPRPLVDVNEVVFACLVGRPGDQAFDHVCKRVYDKLEELGTRSDSSFPSPDPDSRRGAFAALNVGITHGTGTKRPVNLHAKERIASSPLAAIIDDLLNDEDVKKLAAFASYSLSLWSPRLYKYYKDKLDSLWEREPHLLQNFIKSVFPCATFNAGPNVWTRRHRDSMNCAFGMCAIQALGDFDPTQGGHLVLSDLKLVIEFPAGSTVLIPSATLTHSNVPVREGERRASFTQFCPGGLLRYIDSDFKTEKALKISRFAEYKKHQQDKLSLWRRGLDMWSPLSSIIEGQV